VTDLSVQLGPLRLAHPLINGSGTLELFDLAEAVDQRVLTEPPVAAYVTKTITIAPRAGNPPPRILETPGGMINAIGLPGEGLEAFVADNLPRLLALPCPLILSVGGFSQAEYVDMAAGLRATLDATAGEDWTARVGLELNISCPNVHSGCASIGSDPTETEQVVGAVRGVWPGLLVAKLTPNVTEGRGGCYRRRQHLQRTGTGPRDSEAVSWKHHRRSFGSGHQTAGSAGGVRALRRSIGAASGHWRSGHGGGRDGVHRLRR
jgi:dihydroorotate dehydrogenase